FPVKAAFLARFGNYVDWPAAAFASATAPLVLCVVGDDPLGAALDKAAAAQPVNGRPVAVRRLKAARPDSGCHIVYFPPGEGARLGAQLDGLRGAPVLTVSDAKAPPAGIINFVVKEDRVRFDVDDESAMQ